MIFESLIRNRPLVIEFVDIQFLVSRQEIESCCIYRWESQRLGNPFLDHCLLYEVCCKFGVLGF